MFNQSKIKHSTPRKLQAENRRIQLIDIALSLFAERGVENVSIKELATQAHVAQGLIYHYFQSKDELLTAIIKQNNPMPDFEAIIKQLENFPASEGLLLLAQNLSKLLPEKKLVLRLLIRELLSSNSNVHAQVMAFREEALTQLSKYTQSRIDTGELRPHQASLSINILISSFLALLILEQPLESAISPMVDVLLNGIRAE